MRILSYINLRGQREALPPHLIFCLPYYNCTIFSLKEIVLTSDATIGKYLYDDIEFPTY